MLLMTVDEDPLIVRVELLMHRACIQQLGFLKAQRRKSGCLVSLPEVGSIWQVFKAHTYHHDECLYGH